MNEVFVFDRGPIEFSVINTEPPTPIFFLD